MAINIFEGARRAAKLVAGAGVLWYFVYVFTNSPSASLHYSVNWPDEKPALLKSKECEGSVKWESRYGVSTKGGKEVSLNMCFVKHSASDGSMLVFYRKQTIAEALKIIEDGLRKAKLAGDYAAIATFVVELDKLRAPEASPKNYIGNKDYSDEVTEYTKRTINAFVIPAEDEEWIEKRRWSAIWRDVWAATLILLAGLAGLWAFTWAVGWILRGFMGIPRGADSRSQS